MTLREKIAEAAGTIPLRVPALTQLLGTRWGIPRAEVKLEVLRMIDDGALVVGDDYLVRLREQP